MSDTVALFHVAIAAFFRPLVLGPGYLGLVDGSALFFGLSVGCDLGLFHHVY